VIATGEGKYDFLPGLDKGCYEQRVEDWDAALRTAMSQVSSTNLNIFCIACETVMEDHPDSKWEDEEDEP